MADLDRLDYLKRADALSAGVARRSLAQVPDLGLKAGFGPQFVAELGLDLIPDLRELFVAAQFAAGDRGDDLFVDA